MKRGTIHIYSGDGHGEEVAGSVGKGRIDGLSGEKRGNYPVFKGQRIGGFGIPAQDGAGDQAVPF